MLCITIEKCTVREINIHLILCKWKRLEAEKIRKTKPVSRCPKSENCHHIQKLLKGSHLMTMVLET